MNVSMQKTFIIFDDNVPAYIFINYLEAIECMRSMGDRKLLCIKNILTREGSNSHVSSEFMYDMINISMLEITHTSNGTSGICKSHTWHKYIPFESLTSMINHGIGGNINNSMYDNAYNSHNMNDLHNINDSQKIQNSIMDNRAIDKLKNNDVHNTQSVQSTHYAQNIQDEKYKHDMIVKMTTKSNPPHLHDYNSPYMQNNAQINTKNNIHNKNKTQTNMKHDKTTLEDELFKLTEALQSTAQQNKQDIIPDLENIYTGVAEEALLDDEIKRMKKRFDKIDKNNSDNDNDSNSDNDSYDLISSDFDEDKNEEEDDEIEMDISDDMPDELKTLIEARNSLKADIYEQNVIVDKAQEKLNEDLFIKRCKEQDIRREERKKKEGLSILASDKNVYLKLRGKIRKGILQEKNISPLFMYKYLIIKFMHEIEAIEFTKNADIENEYYIFCQFQKTLDIFEADEFDNDDEYKDKLIDEIDRNYLDICMEFLEIIANCSDFVASDKKVHAILNENPEIKKVIFREAADTSVFDKDHDKEEFKCMEKQGDDNITKDEGVIPTYRKWQ